ncbi:MAG: DUF2797 domain-containing protein [Bacteroidales bacterium]|nr:DUF2797 domain-containing protein [Bacteroidales bacterium]MCF8389908.1 DUF2797 domain-containing protein [Bacteroidales bacterium]
MKIQGNLLKMQTDLQSEIQYNLKLGEERVFLNNLLSKEIKLEYLQEIHCIKCGRQTKTSFAQGYCYPCFTTAPETEDCVLRPELCQAHLGIARDMDYAEKQCLSDHVVYLALTSGVKVGVTRSSQIPTRWIDQGAWKTIKLAVTPNRYIAGNIEVALKQHLNDKTNWRHMLLNKLADKINLVEEKDRAIDHLHNDFQEYATDDDEILELKYPVIKYPEKVKSINFDKTPVVEGKLTGIKGQYLIFESGEVLNIRKHGGYLVELTLPLS